MNDLASAVPSEFKSKAYTGLPVVGAQGNPIVEVGPEVATGEETDPAVCGCSKPRNLMTWLLAGF